jgi:hypothetical protein
VDYRRKESTEHFVAEHNRSKVNTEILLTGGGSTPNTLMRLRPNAPLALCLPPQRSVARFGQGVLHLIEKGRC